MVPLLVSEVFKFGLTGQVTQSQPGLVRMAVEAELRSTLWTSPHSDPYLLQAARARRRPL